MNQQPEQKALRWRLRLIFLYYASYADKNNYKLLKSQNYKRYLIDSESVVEQSGFAPFDIAFRKVHSSSIKLDQFLELLPVIAQLVYKNKNRKDAFRLYFAHHIQKLYNQILSHSQFGADVMAIQNLVVEKGSLDILNSGALQKAYSKYIESTSMHQKQPDQTFEQLHSLLSDFEISPKLVYKAMAYVVFYYQIQLINTKCWGFHNLQELLVCFAQLHWRRVEQGYANQEHKLTRLLQHMETSIGFRKMVEKHRKESSMQLSFFKKPMRIVTEIKDSFEKERFATYQKSQPMSSRNQHAGKFSSSSKRDKQVDIGPIVTLLDDQNDIAGQLRLIFERLCSHGEVGNTQTLKSIKIKRYFKGLNILAQLQQTWVDITITDLCRTSHSGKIEFPHFLKLLQIVAAKLNIDEEGFYHYLIEHCEAEPGVTNSYFSSKVTTARQLNEPRALNILTQVKKPLEKIYNHFRVSREGLSFEQLTHMLYQFDIFPSFINKSTLYAYFQKRAKASSEVKKLVGQTSLDFINFLEVLADVSTQLGDNLTEQERVIFVLQRMQDSQGHRTLLGSEGSNLIGDLRSKYAYIYKQNLIKQSPKKPEGFEQLLQDMSP